MAVAGAVGREVARTMVRAVAVEVARAFFHLVQTLLLMNKEYTLKYKASLYHNLVLSATKFSEY